MYFGVYQVVLNGSIACELQAAAGAVEVVGGNALLHVSAPGQRELTSFFGLERFQLLCSIEPGLRINPEASIAGKMVYTNETNQSQAIQGSENQEYTFSLFTLSSNGFLV